ncbi:MAG TPA: DNA adenine methylase [Planktothrix sp.]
MKHIINPHPTSNSAVAEKFDVKLRSPLRYPGGKQKAIEQISRLLRNSHEYREPLVGGGSVYFHARSLRLAKRYWINDKFAELISFWKTVQDPDMCVRLMKELEQLREKFKSAEQIKKYFLKAREEKPDDPYREALLFFFFNRVTFSGTTRAGGFSSAASLNRFTASSIERLMPMPEALAGTKITNQGFESVINKPGKDVFIFLDPPYFTATKLYGHGGSLHDFDHDRLAHLLKRTDHRFLITYDDCSDIRKLYEWAEIKGWSLRYGMNNCSLQHESKIGAELFIANYKLD